MHVFRVCPGTVWEGGRGRRSQARDVLSRGVTPGGTMYFNLGAKKFDALTYGGVRVLTGRLRDTCLTSNVACEGLGQVQVFCILKARKINTQ